MIQIIRTEPNEKGTAVVTATVVDENGDALTFDQLTNPQWQLMMPNGYIINNRSFADSALTALTWVLYGDDLAIFGVTDDGDRVLTFTATYDSTLGSNLPLHSEFKFKVQALLGIADDV